MLTHPTHDRLIALGLTGMAKAMEDQRRQPDIAALAFEERIAMMIDREAIERENKRLTTRLKFACLRQSAIVEDVDMKALRGLDKALFQKLAAGRLDRPAPKPDRHRIDRCRQELACLCARSQGLPRRSLRLLSARAQAVRCVGAGTRRRPAWPAAQNAGARRAPDPRRLGARNPDAGSRSRSIGDHR